MIARTTSSPNADHWIDRCHLRLRIGEFLRSAADWLTLYLFAFGAAVLVVKLGSPKFWPQVLWLAAGSLPVAVAAWIFPGRRQFSRRESIALLDSRLQAGGLLMTLCEAPDNEWRQQLPQLETMWRRSLPRLRPIRCLRQLSPAIVFFVIACVVPPREVEASTELRSTAGQQAAQMLEELLTELDDSGILDIEERQELQGEIDRLLDETEDTPLTHEKWETVDALQQRMRLRLDQSAAELDKALEALAGLQSSADEGQMTVSPETQMQLEKEMFESLREMMDRGTLQNTPESLHNELRELMESGQPQLPDDPDERQKLIEELKRALAEESQELTELRSKCQGGQCRSPGDQKSSRREGNTRPGHEEVAQGRGDAPLNWGDESNEEGTRFKETVLPKGMLDRSRDEVVGLSTSAPEVESGAPTRRRSPGGAAAASGDETWSRSVRPRHRSVVRRYFDGDREE